MQRCGRDSGTAVWCGLNEGFYSSVNLRGLLSLSRVESVHFQSIHNQSIIISLRFQFQKSYLKLSVVSDFNFKKYPSISERIITQGSSRRRDQRAQQQSNHYNNQTATATAKSTTKTPTGTSHGDQPNFRFSNFFERNLVLFVEASF
jgi:hypothetical protein